MDTISYEALLPFKIQDLVSLIKERKHYGFEKSIRYLYKSELYNKLSNEETKLWHLSSEKLLEMLECEKKTHILYYPDFV